jgi:GTP-binding protein
MQWLGESGIPFSILFTKADKLTKAKARASVEAYEKKLLETWEEMPPYFVTSAENKEGREEVLDYIAQINQSIQE